MQRFALAVLLMPLVAVCSSQAATPQLPEMVTVRMYPDGRFRGHQLDFTKLVVNGTTATALVTMQGKGRNGCTVQAHPSDGTFDGTKLTLTLKIEPDDKVTCPTGYELVRAPDGKFSGHYMNLTAGQKGVLKPE